MAIRDKSGQKFGRLTVVELAPREEWRSKGKAHWRCLCECGNETIILTGNLHKGGQLSCGCLRIEWAKENVKLATAAATTHGGSGNNIAYGPWVSMRTRCRNPNNPKYNIYGGRGIQVDPKWESFTQFLEDMGPRPSLEYSIDRIDPDGNYELGNCRWATKKAQNRNQQPKDYIYPPCSECGCRCGGK